MSFSMGHVGHMDRPPADDSRRSPGFTRSSVTFMGGAEVPGERRGSPGDNERSSSTLMMLRRAERGSIASLPGRASFQQRMAAPNGLWVKDSGEAPDSPFSRALAPSDG